MFSVRGSNQESKTPRDILQGDTGMSQIQQTLRVPVSREEYVEVPGVSSNLTRIDIGFTGTRQGMTPKQQLGIISALKHIEYFGTMTFFPGNSPVAGNCPELWAHHGDCKGSDEEFHGFAMNRGYNVHVHPPNIDRLRAFCLGTINSPPRSYIGRDKDITETCLFLLATPHGEERSLLYSGTWATIRMARRLKKPVVIFWPDGRIEIH